MNLEKFVIRLQFALEALIESGRVEEEYLWDLSFRLKTKREHRKLTLRQTADQIGVSTATLSRLERGSDISLKTALKILEWVTAKQK